MIIIIIKYLFDTSNNIFPAYAENIRIVYENSLYNTLNPVP